jgi:hypothetical protein
MGSKKQAKALAPIEQKHKPPKIQRLSYRKRQRFLELYKATNAKLHASCKGSKLDTSTFYNWYENDPEFKNQVLAAEQDIFDTAYQSIQKQAKKGNVAAAKFILERDGRFKQEKQITDNRRIVINYPNW